MRILKQIGFLAALTGLLFLCMCRAEAVSFTVAPLVIQDNQTTQVFVVGTATTWATGTTTWSATGITGDSVTAQTIYTPTCAYLTVSCPNGSVGTITLSDGTHTATITVLASIPIHTTNWSTGSIGSATAGSANSTTGAGDGWIDLLGNSWTSASAYGVTGIAPTNATFSGYLLRPASETTNARDEGIGVYFISPGINLSNTTPTTNNNYAYQLWLVTRYQSGGGCYAGYINCGVGGVMTVSLGHISAANAITGIGTAAQGYAAPAGDLCYAWSTSSGASPSTVTISAADLTTGLPIGSVTTTDSTSSPNIQQAGQVGFVTSGTFTVLQATSFNCASAITGSAGFSFDQPNATTSTNITLHATNYGASWGSTPTFTPSAGSISSVSLSGQVATMTFTPPSSAQTVTISDSLDSAFASVNVTAAPGAATGFTVTAPVSSNAQVEGLNTRASQNFTVSMNGYLSSNATVALTDNGAGGTFTPSSVTMTANGSLLPLTQTFTYTPALSAGGTVTITPTSSGLTASPTILTYAVSRNVGISNAAWFWSPDAWVTNSGRTGGTTWEQTNLQGNYARFYFSSTASNPTFNVTFMTNSPTGNFGPVVSLDVDGIFYDNISFYNAYNVTGIQTYGVPVVGSGSHVVTIWFRNCIADYAWAGTANTNNNVVRILNATVDGYSTLGTAPATTKWGQFICPSIGVGTYAYTGGTDDSLVAYTHLEGEAFRKLGYEYCVNGFSGGGFTVTGDADNTAPSYYPMTGTAGSRTYQGNGTSGGTSANMARWCWLDPNNSQLDSNSQLSAYGSTNTAPSFIQINYSDNEARTSYNITDFENSIIGCIGALRTAAPNAWIFVGPDEEDSAPVGLTQGLSIPESSGFIYNTPTYAAAVDTAVNAYLTANPSENKVKLIDMGVYLANQLMCPLNGSYGSWNNVHPGIAGHALEAGYILNYIQQAMGISLVYQSNQITRERQ